MSTPKSRALEEQIASGKIVTDKAKILAFIRKNPGQNYMLIGKYLGLAQKTISGRLSELEDMGLIMKIDSGNYSAFYPINGDSEQELFRQMRETEKLKLWARRGLKMNISEDLKEQLKTIV